MHSIVVKITIDKMLLSFTVAFLLSCFLIANSNAHIFNAVTAVNPSNDKNLFEAKGKSFGAALSESHKKELEGWIK